MNVGPRGCRRSIRNGNPQAASVCKGWKADVGASSTLVSLASGLPCTWPNEPLLFDLLQLPNRRL